MTALDDITAALRRQGHTVELHLLARGARVTGDAVKLQLLSVTERRVRVKAEGFTRAYPQPADVSAIVTDIQHDVGAATLPTLKRRSAAWRALQASGWGDDL